MKIGNIIYLLLHVLINSSLENEISDNAYTLKTQENNTRNVGPENERTQDM